MCFIITMLAVAARSHTFTKCWAAGSSMIVAAISLSVVDVQSLSCVLRQGQYEQLQRATTQER